MVKKSFSFPALSVKAEPGKKISINTKIKNHVNNKGPFKPGQSLGFKQS
jgi:hypothetical protein